MFYRLFINFVNIDNHFKVVHVILSENKKSFYYIIIIIKKEVQENLMFMEKQRGSERKYFWEKQFKSCHLKVVLMTLKSTNFIITICASVQNVPK